MTFSNGEIIALPSDEGTPSWQVRALDRSLSSSRTRSVARLSQFVQAARGLAEETASSSFTVQQVVTRSGQSLKSFYRYFASKDDLLLALFEEDIGVGALFLHELIDQHPDPRSRVRAWLFGVFELMSAGDQGYVALLVREHQRLAETRPEQMDSAIAPFIDLLVDELAHGVEADAVRVGDPQRDAQMVFRLTLDAIHDLVSGRDEREPQDIVEYLWRFCWAGLEVSGPT